MSPVCHAELLKKGKHTYILSSGDKARQKVKLKTLYLSKTNGWNLKMISAKQANHPCTWVRGRNVTRLIALDIQTPALKVFGCLGLHYQLKQCNLKGSSFNITTITIGVASSFNSPQFVTTKLDPT